jgi:kynurenine formamidase
MNTAAIRVFLQTSLAILLMGCSTSPPNPPVANSVQPADLWQVYDAAFKDAKYIDLTHTITPSIPVWKGFGRSKFGQARNPETGKPYQYTSDGFEATEYNLATDQLGTQLDPPAHWAPEFPAIDELPPTFTLRPLVVISIVSQVASTPAYHLQVSDIASWESKNGMIPRGSVVMV